MTFLDLLGYREILEGMDLFPHPQSDPEIAGLRRSFARALRLRRRLLAGIEQFMTGQKHVDPALLRGLPPEAVALANEWRRIQMFKLPGPDHLVLGCSLHREQQHYPMRALWTLMFGTASAMLMQLTMGADDFEDTRPLRGGVDVAMGCLLQPEGFLYSPALTRAYDLESKEAKFPRTVVGPRFVAVIAEHAKATGSVDAEHVADMARIIQRMMFDDRDGKTALDFMGPEIRRSLDADFARRLATQAWQYVQRASAAPRRPEVQEKYDWLLEYVRSRVTDWGVAT